MSTAKRKADVAGDSTDSRDPSKLRKLDHGGRSTGSGTSRRDGSQALQIQDLPDELLLRVLHFLWMKDVIACQSVSRRLSTFAKDSQVWKRMYYAYFVYTRFTRSTKYGILKGKPMRPLNSRFDKMAGMDWKSKFRLSYKWSKGTCSRQEIILASKTLPQTFLALRGNVAITADVECGVRAWGVRKNQHTLIATGRLAVGDECHHLRPSALSVEVDSKCASRLLIAVGFSGGMVGLYTFDTSAELFVPLQIFSCFENQAVSSLSQAGHGYLLGMSPSHTLSLFQVDWDRDEKEPTRVYSVRSQSEWTPVSVNLRASATSLMASIVYVFPRFISGWSVGLQELRWDPNSHELLSSRLATNLYEAAQGGFRNQKLSSKTPYLPPTTTKPTSLYYTHPYLLATHPDNTLSLYMVRSTHTELSISSGIRLWGHTSDIHAANIGDRGKAVTVAQGGDIRVWELEEGLTSAQARKATPGPMVSVQLQPGMGEELPQPIRQLQLEVGSDSDQLFSGEVLPVSVDFDEERLIVLKNSGANAQALSVYDFT